MVSTDPGALYQGFPMLGGCRAQIWPYSPNYRRPRHFHAEPELNLVVSGTAVFGVGERQLAVHAGELVSFAPGQDHLLLAGSPGLALFAIALRSDYSRQVLGRTRPAFTQLTAIRLEPDAFRDLVHRVDTHTERENSDSQIAELWERLWQPHGGPNARGGELHVSTRRAVAALIEEPTLGRDALARLSRANPTELSRRFHHDLGMTLVQYRARLRLLEFIRQVDSGTRNLMAASAAAGFGSYSQCHRQFFGQLGMAPQDFFRNGTRQRMEQTFLPVITP